MQRSFWSTIRGKLLSRTLLVALLPVLVIGGVAIASLRSLSGTADASLGAARTALNEDVVGDRVASTSTQIARELAIFLDERLSDTETWSTDPGFIEGAIDAARRANELGLVNLSIEDAEARFEDDPRLGDATVEADLANAVLNTPAFKEIFITDVNGFNVDFSNPTSDFVQSDESWWTNAMDNGLDISEPEFDASAGVFAIDISIRLEDEGRPVGVLKAALDVQVMQVITDRFAGGTDQFDITIVDPAGLFLAETSSNHEPSHIMNPIFLASTPTASTDIVREVFAPNAAELHADGFSITDEGVGGFAHVADELTALRNDMELGVAAFNWTVVVEQPRDVAFAALAPLEGLAGQVSSTSSNLSILLGLVAALGAIGAAGMALIFGNRITSPIARLRDAAVEAAEVTLPNVVAQMDELGPDEELPELEPLVLRTGDEVEDLAHSFNSVQQTAANLASDQARMRRTNVATTFVNLGRRNQNLLSRQLEHINSMEDSETNSETLQRLFQLDHLATRMRRNAESLLVLAGEETPRRFRQPVSMHQLLQAAGGEIEDFARIELTSLDEASVEGGAASDVAHLLAELLENASSFSPPGSPIQVHGRRRENSYLLAIVDQGIGMEEAELQAANARLADPAEFDRAPSAYLGHFVVGHLAKRHGIRVRVTDSPYGGLAAQLQLPASILGSSERAPRATPPAPVPNPNMHEGPAAELTESEQAEIAALERSLLDDPPAPVVPEAPAVAAPAVAELPPVGEIPGVDSIMTDPFDEQPAIYDQEQAPMPMPEPAPIQPSPAVASVAPIAPEAPAAVVPTPEPAPAPASVVEAPASAPGAPAETTPSGFRRRVRGQEGAPKTASPVVQEQPAAPARRTPEEVQASLAAFRQGVESGRARSAAAATATDVFSELPDFEGDAQ